VVELDRRIDRHVSAGDEARAHAARGMARAGALRDLLAEAFLLDEPDLAARLGDLDAALGAAARARTELGRVAEAPHGG
jgi:hypothetical protein